jgi:hypothetical protein
MLPTSELLIASNGVATFSGGLTLPGNFLVNLGTLHVGNFGMVLPAAGTLTINTNGIFDSATTLFQSNGGVVNLNGGTFAAGLISSGEIGTFNFNSGTIATNGITLDFAMLDYLLGDIPTLLGGHNIVVGGLAALQSNLTIDGGQFSAGTLTGGSFLTLKTGTFSLSNSSLSVAAGGLLGNNLAIGPNLTVNAASINIGTAGVAVISGGTLSAAGSLSILQQGEVNLTSPSSVLAAPVIFINGGLLHGTGQVLNEVFVNFPGVIRAATGDRLVLAGGFSNAGTINLLGGEIDSQLASNNFTVISGRGELITHGITNSGTVALSAGISDFTGTLTNNGTVILTGGGTATFYDAVNNSGTSLFRISTNSTAVFLGNVTGLAAFTGNGVKDFEGSASGGGIATSGSSIVGGITSLTADSIREDSLTVIGVAKINANGGPGGASHLHGLTIDGSTDTWDGKLDVTNNSLVIDYDGASPISTIANQIKTAFHNGDWTGNGITSSLASSIAPHPTAVGFAEASALGLTTSFLGQPTDTSSVLIRYVFSGDANLDGVVNALDFNLLASHFGDSSILWNQGDFNYDGITNTADFAALASNFNQSLLAGPSLATLVPEPWIVMSAWPLLLYSRRRRRCCDSPEAAGDAA